MIKGKTIWLLQLGLAGLILIVASCTESNVQDRVVTMTGSDLSGRLQEIHEVVSWDTTVTLKKTSGRARDSLLLILQAETSTPVLDGNALQATDISIEGNRAYVTYALRGDAFGGGVDVFNITDNTKPVLEAGIYIKDSDVNGICVTGNDMYLAIAREPGSGVEYAALEHFTLKGGLPGTKSDLIDLPSWAATDVTVSGNQVFVTTGAVNGYICILNKTSLALVNQISLEDARGVAAENNKVAVFAGTPAHLYYLNSEGSALADYSLTGATIADSKSTVEVLGGKAIIAAGDGGMQIVCLESGDILGEIPVPAVNGLDASVCVANAATANNDLIFIANGEAGVYAVQCDKSLNANQCDTGSLQLQGKLVFDTNISANDVLYRAGTLFVASGLGGLKIISIETI